MRQSRRGSRRRPNAGLLVSVVVCNYNQGRYLERAIESLAQQTHHSIELWLVDDGSTDGSPALMTRLARRLRERFAAIELLLRRNNAGQLACLNVALNQARGTLTVVFDADDLLAPTFVAGSVEAMRSHRERDPSVGFVYTDCELVDSEDRLLGIGRSVPWDGALLERSSYIPGCAATLTTALHTGMPFDESIRVGTKHHRWLRLNEAGWTGHHLARPLFSYRLHAGNNSGIGARLLPELDGRPGSERLLGRVWPTAIPGGAST